MSNITITTWLCFIIFLFVFIPSASGSARRLPEQGLKKFHVGIQGYSPTREDDYVAVSFKAEPGYIVEFEPSAHADRVHHMLLYGCTVPAYTDRSFWQGGATCANGNHILYAWARNAPPLQLPENVAFAIGNKEDAVQYIVLQIHYAKRFQGNVRDFSGVTLHLSPQKPKFLAGVYLFLSGETILPGHQAYFTNMSCTYSSDTQLFPFAFRTHTHAMGRVVSAYVKKQKEGGKWTQIGKRNPQWPQLFQKRDSPLVIEKGDFLAGTCRFDSRDKKEPVPMGSMGVNEMCNFYMMYYQDAAEADPFPYGAGCYGDQDPETVSREYPEEGLTLLPPHPEWEHQAHQSGKSFGVLEREKVTQLGGEQLGQIAGLALDQEGKLVILHRAGRVWDGSTFDGSNMLNDKKPIERPVVLVASQSAKGKLELAAKYGQNKFFLPHGIFVDQSGSLYTTDVGSHQVIKWRIQNGEIEPVWSLGRKFEPGSDQQHFCKPAGVAVSRQDGSVFVADGYCNNRVMKFSKDGHFLSQFGQSVSRYSASIRLGEFSLPHDIALDEPGDRLFVADREDGRVQSFSMSSGKPLSQVKNEELFSTVYSVHFQPSLGLVFVPGTPLVDQSGQPKEIHVYVVPPNSTGIQYSFRPQSGLFQLPHVLRTNGKSIWVGEIAQTGGVLWQLEVQSDSLLAEGQHKEHQMGVSVFGMGAGTDEGGEGKAGLLSALANSPPLSTPFSTAQFAFGSALVLLMVLCSVCCALYLVLWRCCCQGEQDIFDKKGFQPLRTSDGLDPEGAFSSSDSEDEGPENPRRAAGISSKESGL